jgi:hypothetical protein
MLATIAPRTLVVRLVLAVRPALTAAPGRHHDRLMSHGAVQQSDGAGVKILLPAHISH